MKPLAMNILAVVVAILFLVLLGVIKSREQDIDEKAFCRKPKVGERLIAEGSADGKPVCVYHKNNCYLLTRRLKMSRQFCMGERAMNEAEQFYLSRQKYIGGSDVAAILGISPWRNIVDLWLDKTAPPVADSTNLAAKKRGQRLEPYILDMIREDYGLTIAKTNERYIDKELDFLSAEIDAETDSGENIEIKTVHPFKAKDWGETGTDELPIHYVAQVQHGLGVTGRERCRVYALIGDDLQQYIVERDDVTIQAMRERCAEFWDKYVLPKVQPPIDYTHKDVLETLKRLYPGTDGTIIEATAMHEHWRAVFETAQDMEKKYKGVVDGAKAHLLSEMGSASAIRFSDGKEFARKVVNKKAYTVDVAASSYVDFRLANIKEK